MSNNITNDTSDRSSAKRTVRGHLASVPVGEWADEAMTVDASPDGMGGWDAAAALRVEDEPAPPAAPTPTVEGPNVERPAAAREFEGNASPAPVWRDLDDDELTYSDDGTISAKAPKRSILRRRQRTAAQVDDQEFATAVGAATGDVWAAHRQEASSEAGADTELAPAWDQIPMAPTLPRDERRSGRHRPAGWLLLVAILLIFIAGGLVVLLGGRGTPAKASRLVNHHASTPIVTLTPPSPKGTVPTTTARAATPRVRKYQKKHHHTHAKVRRTVTSQAPVTTTVATVITTPVVQAHSTPVVSSTSPASGTNSTTSTKTSSSSGGSSKESSAGTGAVPTGGLPGIKQTEQQP